MLIHNDNQSVKECNIRAVSKREYRRTVLVSSTFYVKVSLAVSSNINMVSCTPYLQYVHSTCGKDHCQRCVKQSLTTFSSPCCSHGEHSIWLSLCMCCFSPHTYSELLVLDCENLKVYYRLHLIVQYMQCQWHKMLRHVFAV